LKLFRRANADNSGSEGLRQTLPAVEFSEQEAGFWASFVHDFVISDEWFATMRRLIEYWRGIDTDAYPMYEPLQTLSDWELAYATEVWVVYEFISTYVQYGELDGIDPEIGSETRTFISEYFAALARKMDEGDINGFVETLKSQIKQFGVKDLQSEGSASRFKPE
jgi:hypothetical protein